MEARKSSQIALVIGLSLGLFGLWLGTTPVTGDTLETTGGIASFRDQLINGEYVAVRTYPCSYADYTSWQGCHGYTSITDPDARCDSSASISVAEGCTGGSREVVPGSDASCTGHGYCYDLWHATLL